MGHVTILRLVIEEHFKESRTSKIWNQLETEDKMIERYTRPEMGAIWTEENRFKAWLEVEILSL